MPTAFVHAAALAATGDREAGAALRQWLEEKPRSLRPPMMVALELWLEAWLDEPAEAPEIYGRAAAILREIPRPWECAWMLERQAEAAAAAGRPAESSLPAAEAERIYAELGALPALERLRERFGDPAAAAGE